MKRLILIALVVLPMAAVAAKKPLPLAPNSGAALAGKTVVVTRHDKASFIAFTPGKAVFAMIGAAAMISAGNAIVRENDIAILIEALEPRQNRKRGDDLSAVEYIQREDPEIQKKRVKESLELALNKM